MAPSPASLEQRVQDLGRRMLERTRDVRHTLAGAFQEVWSGRYHEERMLGRLMADESVRTRMLRFVDVLPALTDDEALVRHAREYFADKPLPVPLPLLDRFPGLSDWALSHADHGIPAHVVAGAVRAVVGRLARRFIAGHDVRTVERSLRRLHHRHMGFTLDLLGEATVSEAEAEQYQRQYLEMLEGLAPHVSGWPAVEGGPPLETIHGRVAPRLNVSVKLTSLYSQSDPVDTAGSAEAIKARLRPILESAMRHGAFINLDMEQYDTKAITLRVFREVLEEPAFRAWPDVGIALQAYLRETPRDLAELVEWARQREAPVTVRLVRGAYWDFESVIARQNHWPVPVWTRKPQTDACYETCLRMLLEAHPHVEAAIGTHNLRSLALGMALAETTGLTPDQYEIQMLYGMADPFKTELVEMGQRLRVYVPFGELIPGMAYLVRRLLENTSSQSFLRMSAVEEASADELLAPPRPDREDDGLRVPGADGSGDAAAPEDEAARPQAQRPAADGPASDAQDEPASHAERGEDEQVARAGSAADEGLTTAGRPGGWPLTEPFLQTPVRRFVSPVERRAFATSIERVEGQLGGEVPLLIAGRQTPGADVADSVDPARPDRVVGRVAAAGASEAAAALGAGEEAFAGWGRRPACDRARYLLRAAEMMRARRNELAAWEVFEAGKPWREADADVVEAIDFLEYYAREAVRIERGCWFDVPGEENHYFHEPRGVGAVIAPWNFPLAIVTGMTAAAIATGNTVVLKPAPQTPVVAWQLVEVFRDAGLPDGVLNFLPGPDETGEVLVRDTRTQFIAFTGSRSVGCRIFELGARVEPGQDHLKRVVAEMGGKNAVIIDRDADVDDAVAGTVRSAFGYAGQKCSAASRAIVVGDLHDAFVRRLTEAASSIRVGPPRDPGTFMGPVIDAEAYERIRTAIESGRAHGRVAVEVDVSRLRDGTASPGHYVGPTVFTDVDPASPLGQEEIFGPVLAVMRATTFEEALEIANGTPFALTGGVWSRSPAHLELARREFRVGNLYLNRKITGAIVGRQPFGGMKMSGVGSKAGGPDYVQQFTVPRTVTENTIRRGFAPEEGA